MGDTAMVDFGLSNEFMRPVRTLASFDADPLAALGAALSDLERAEFGAVQVLFQPVTAPWVESVLRAVTDDRGGSFFVDAPEMLGLAREKVRSPLHAVAVRAEWPAVQPVAFVGDRPPNSGRPRRGSRDLCRTRSSPWQTTNTTRAIVDDLLFRRPAAERHAPRRRGTCFRWSICRPSRCNSAAHARDETTSQHPLPRSGIRSCSARTCMQA